MTVVGADNVDIRVKNSSRVYVTMHAITGQNQIITEKGMANVIVPTTAVYELTTASNSGAVTVNLSQFAENGGYHTKASTTNYINCTDVASAHGNKLAVTTNSGTLLLLDENLAQ